ncbi:hypothetical protein QOT17_006556 [Balamuthia mandrillaris]
MGRKEHFSTDSLSFEPFALDAVNTVTFAGEGEGSQSDDEDNCGIQSQENGSPQVLLDMKLDSDSWLELLHNDNEFSWIVEAIEGNEEACQRKTPCQLVLMEQCFLQDGYLLRMIWPDKAKVKQATIQQIVLKELRNKILCQFHDVPTGGHFGLMKMYSCLIMQYWWPGIHKDVEH